MRNSKVLVGLQHEFLISSPVPSSPLPLPPQIQYAPVPTNYMYVCRGTREISSQSAPNEKDTVRFTLDMSFLPEHTNQFTHCIYLHTHTTMYRENCQSVLLFTLTAWMSGRRELMVMWNNIIPFNDHEWFYYVTISCDVVNRTMANKFGWLLANVPSSWDSSSLIIYALLPGYIYNLFAYSTHAQQTSIYVCIQKNITLILVTACNIPFYFYLHTFFNLITMLCLL